MSGEMATVVIRLDPHLLDNPDADIRYRLSELLAERSAGVIRDDGYDYAGQGPMLLLFLEVSNLELAIESILDVVENVRVLGNALGVKIPALSFTTPALCARGLSRVSLWLCGRFLGHPR